MSEKSKRRLITPKSKRYLIAVVVLMAIALLVFAEVVRPNQDAKSYTKRLESASEPLDSCFRDLAETTQQDIFYAPDIDLVVKQKNVKSIQDHIAACRIELGKFNSTAHELLALHFAGYTKTYREAQLNQHHAFNIVSQSEDVMDQYGNMADFLSQYYANLGGFLNTFDALNKAQDSNTLSNANRKVSNQAASLRANAKAIRALKAPTGLADAQNSTATMIEQAATGFENLARGLDGYSDTYQNLGYKQIDAALETYDKSVIGKPYEVLKNSYVLKQINALPAKVENLLAGETE